MSRVTETTETIGTTEYKIKLLPATEGNEINLKLFKLGADSFESIAKIAKKPEIRGMIEKYVGSKIEVTEELLNQSLPEELQEKLKPLVGQTFKNAVALMDKVKNLLSDKEIEENRAVIVGMMAQEGLPDLQTILSVSGEIGGLIKEIIQVLDSSEITKLQKLMIKKSVQRFKPEGETHEKDFIDTEKHLDHFDDHFAGRYNEILELFVFLIIFNFLESWILLKKNRILTYITPYLGMIGLKPDEEKN